MKRKSLAIPSTRNHHQLATWINSQGLVDNEGRAVVATVERSKYNTDRHPKGVRYRIVGRGRWGLVLEIRLKGSVGKPDFWHDPNRLYRHHSGETYRKHDEARRWVAENLTYAPSYRCTCLRHDQGFGTERHTYACARRHAERAGRLSRTARDTEGTTGAADP